MYVQQPLHPRCIADIHLSIQLTPNTRSSTLRGTMLSFESRHSFLAFLACYIASQNRSLTDTNVHSELVQKLCFSAYNIMGFTIAGRAAYAGGLRGQATGLPVSFLFCLFKVAQESIQAPGGSRQTTPLSVIHPVLCPVGRFCVEIKKRRIGLAQPMFIGSVLEHGYQIVLKTTSSVTAHTCVLRPRCAVHNNSQA